MIVKQQKAGLNARVQRPRVLDLGLLQTVGRQMGLSHIAVDPGWRTDVFDTSNTRQELNYHPNAEPDYRNNLERLGLTPHPPYAHTMTQLLDLANGLATTVAQFATAARRNTRKALADTSVRYETVPFRDASRAQLGDIHELHKTFKASRPWLLDQVLFLRGLVTHFADKGWFSLAYRGPQLVGVVYMICHDRVAYYHTAYTSDAARVWRVPTGLVYASICEAIRRGCDIFDLVGLYDPRYPERYRRWQGFSTFKRRFGGISLLFPPAFALRLAG